MKRLWVLLACAALATVTSCGAGGGPGNRTPAGSAADSGGAAVLAETADGGAGDNDVPQKAPDGWVDDPDRPLVVDSTGPVPLATSDRPNIVVLMVDDLAEMDLRVWERLPTIKARFLDHGIRFTSYYGNDPLCCPGRATFLTGLTTDHHGVYTNRAKLFQPAETLATELAAQGYYTTMVGKYFNGTDKLEQTFPPGWAHASLTGGGYYRYRIYRDGVTGFADNDPNDYSTDVFANDAVAYLRDAPPEKPIFALLTPFGVHAGVDAGGHHDFLLPVAAPRNIGDPRCADVAPWQPADYDEADVSDKPAYIRALHRHDKPSFVPGWPTRPLCETLLSVDDELARVEAELEAQGRLDDTLFILTADNGMTFGAHRWDKKYVPYATQLPLFASWTAGRGSEPATSDAWLSNVDLAPTICELAGCQLGPYPTGQQASDGASFLGLITGSGTAPTREALYEEHREPLGNGVKAPPWRAIRTTPASPLGLWHYIEYDDGARELYDATGGQCRDWSVGDPGDPCELSNLAGDPAHAAVQHDLATLLRSMIVQPIKGVP